MDWPHQDFGAIYEVMKDPRPLGLSPKRARRAAELSLVWSLCLGMSFPAPAWVYAEPTYQDKGIVRSANPAAEADLARKEFLNTKQETKK